MRSFKGTGSPCLTRSPSWPTNAKAIPTMVRLHRLLVPTVGTAFWEPGSSWTVYPRLLSPRASAVFSTVAASGPPWASRVRLGRSGLGRANLRCRTRRSSPGSATTRTWARQTRLHPVTHVAGLALHVGRLANALRDHGEAGLRTTADMNQFETTLRTYCVGYLVAQREPGEE